MLDNPECSIGEIMTVLPGPDFPTGGTICGRSGIIKAYQSGRSTILVRAKTEIVPIPKKKNRFKIVVNELPFQQTRDGVVEKIANLVKTDKVAGISSIRDLSDLKEPVKLEVEVKSDADPEVVLNQLYQFSPLQTSFSMNFMALVDGKPRELSIKDFLTEFIRHRVAVIRRRTQFLLARARKQKHTVEGLLLALADIDQIIKTIRSSKTQAEAKIGLMEIDCPSAMMKRALGDDGFSVFQDERGVAENYRLTAVQADAILKMTLGQLVNLEQEKLGGQHAKLLEEINEYNRILSDEANIRAIIKDDIADIKRKHADDRRTVLSSEELRNVDLEDLIEEENMVVSISHRGYIKRTPVNTYRAQRRGGKGIKGAKSEDEDPIEHIFAASTHDYLLFFTTRGMVHWRKVHQLPALSRESRGRAIINIVPLEDGENVAACRAIRNFDEEDHYLLMVTKNGLVKKTPLSAYGRPRSNGIIAVKLKEDDEIIDVLVAKKGDEIVLSTANGMAIRFRESDARPMGRNTSGVKGISLTSGDSVVGMVVADPEATLLTACEKGYGKRTTTSRYRTQKRGGKGLRDIKTTDRNGKVIGIKAVNNEDELLLMTSRGKIQRIKVADISIIGRNTQGVRIMGLDGDDSLAVIARVPRDELGDDEIVEGEVVDGDSPESTADGAAQESSPAAEPETGPGTEPENETTDGEASSTEEE
ncbi:UNVERIFIED_CONTAM: hypothetical protein GTU68_037278 [Idotea baltica]|nr:hypothetical protein [Idotea baltica]